MKNEELNQSQVVAIDHQVVSVLLVLLPLPRLCGGEGWGEGDLCNRQLDTLKTFRLQYIRTVYNIPLTCRFSAVTRLPKLLDHSYQVRSRPNR